MEKYTGKARDRRWKSWKKCRLNAKGREAKLCPQWKSMAKVSRDRYDTHPPKPFYTPSHMLDTPFMPTL